MQTTTLVMKNLLHYTINIAIAQKLQISAVLDLGNMNSADHKAEFQLS